MKIRLFILFAISLFVCSCSSDDPNENPTDNEVKKRIIRINYSYSTAEDFTFKYNNDGRLDYMTYKYNNGLSYIYVFSYNTDGTLKSVIDTKDDTREKTETNFIYKDAQNIEFERKFYDSAGTISTLPGKMTFNSKGQIIRMDHVWPENFTYFDFEYEYDAKGNVSKFTPIYTTSNGTSRTEIIYKYDNSKNFLSNQGLPLWYWMNYQTFDDTYAGPNNMIECHLRGELNKSYKYDYDEDGYPTAIYDKLENDMKIGEFVYELVK